MSLAHKLEPVFSASPQPVHTIEVAETELSFNGLQDMLARRNKRDLKLIRSSSDNMHHI